MTTDSSSAISSNPFDPRGRTPFPPLPAIDYRTSPCSSNHLIASQGVRDTSNANQGLRAPSPTPNSFSTPQATTTVALRTQAFTYLPTPGRSPVLRFLVATWLGNILTGIGLLIALAALGIGAYSVVLQVVSTRWSLKNDALQSCMAARAMGIYSAYCNATLAAGVIKPPLIDRELSDSATSNGLYHQDPSADRLRKKSWELFCVAAFLASFLMVSLVVLHLGLRSLRSSQIKRMEPTPSQVSGVSVMYRVMNDLGPPELSSHERTSTRRTLRRETRKLQIRVASRDSDRKKVAEEMQRVERFSTDSPIIPSPSTSSDSDENDESENDEGERDLYLADARRRAEEHRREARSRYQRHLSERTREYEKRWTIDSLAQRFNRRSTHTSESRSTSRRYLPERNDDSGERRADAGMRRRLTSRRPAGVAAASTLADSADFLQERVAFR